MASPSLEAKLVVLGAQGVGKTSLVHRYVKNAFVAPHKAQPTVGASFLTTRVQDPESGATIRLQIWDTAGQERFRSISRLYYRGAHAAILCYDVTSKQSFEDMARWLDELREHAGSPYGGGGGGGGGGLQDMILHVVGTKSDVVAADPKKREVPFERCIGYVAEQLYPEIATPGMAGLGTQAMSTTAAAVAGYGTTPPVTVQGFALGVPPLSSSQSNRSSGFWGQEQIWDCCHEISAKDGEGIDEVFRVITRKLVEQHARRQEKERMLEIAQSTGRTPGVDGAMGAPGYFDLPNQGNGSFRLGHGDKRRSWLGSLATPGGLTSYGDDNEVDTAVAKGMQTRRCC